jgi:TonB family protein
MKLEPIKIEKPVYPSHAREERIQGQVLLTLHISETGDVEGVEVISGEPVLVSSAVAAAKKCKFKPFIKNGKPIKVYTELPFNFALAGNVTDFADRPAVPPSPVKSSDSTTNPQDRVASDSAPTMATEPQRIRIASAVSQGLLIHKVQPLYPPEARASQIQGTVILEAIIGKDGQIKDLKFVSGPKALVESAIGAVQQWRYRPYMLNNEPVEVMTQIQVKYTIRAF